MKQHLLGTVLMAVVATTWTGCDRSPNYRIEPQTVAESHIIRFDSLLLQYENLTDSSSYRQMAESLAPFWNIYGRHILGLGDAPYFRNGINSFLQDSTIAQLYADKKIRLPIYRMKNNNCRHLRLATSRFFHISRYLFFRLTYRALTNRLSPSTAWYQYRSIATWGKIILSITDATTATN